MVLGLAIVGFADIFDFDFAIFQPRGLLNFLESDAAVPVKEADLLLPRNNLEAATNEARQKNAVLEKVEGFRCV